MKCTKKKEKKRKWRHIFPFIWTTHRGGPLPLGGRSRAGRQAAEQQDPDSLNERLWWSGNYDSPHTGGLSPPPTRRPKPSEGPEGPTRGGRVLPATPRTTDSKVEASPRLWYEDTPDRETRAPKRSALLCFACEHVLNLFLLPLFLVSSFGTSLPFLLLTLCPQRSSLPLPPPSFGLEEGMSPFV